MGVKPLLLGFQTLGVGTSADEVAAGRRAMADFADREGYCLAEVFVEDGAARSGRAMAALISYAREVDPAGVVVPSRQDLGPFSGVQEATRARLQRDAGVPVLVAGIEQPRTTQEQR